MVWVRVGGLVSLCGRGGWGCGAGKSVMGREFVGKCFGVYGFGGVAIVVVVWVYVLEFGAKVSEDVAHVYVEKEVGHG